MPLNETTDKIHKMYKDLSYLDQYGGSVILFFVLLVLLFGVFAYFYVMKNIQPIKDDWSNQRCNPRVMPFAGFINKPGDKSVSEFTNENFAYCMQNILISITGYLVEPIMYATSNLNNIYSGVGSSLQSVRGMFSNMRTYIGKVAEEIMGRVMNVMTPMLQIIITFVDTLEKTIGILTAGLYTSLGTYYALKAFLGSIMYLLIVILITLAGIIVALWILPFTWGAAITMTTIFISISVVLSVMIAFFSEVLHIRPDLNMPKLPGKPKLNVCFDKNTVLKMENGEEKVISEILVGDVLEKSGEVTAVLKLDAKYNRRAKMFRVNNVVVSGNHKINYFGLWIPVCNCPKRELLSDYDEPYLYCLNTTSKRIFVNGMEFSDWDEIFEEDVEVLKKFCKNLHLYNREEKDLRFIHEYFDHGFPSHAQIKMFNGKKKEMKDIEVGDILRCEEIVYGIVQVKDNEKMASKIKNSSNYLNLEKDKLYHILTDVGTFYVENTKYNDYNYCVEAFLQK